MKILNLKGLANAERLAPPLAVKFASGAEGVIEGYAATFGGPPDSYGHVIAPGAFARSLAQYQASGTSPVFLWSHDPAAPIGRWENLAEDSVGLRVRGQLNLSSDAGQQAFSHLRERDITGLSIGYVVPQGGASVDDAGAIVLEQIDLFEISAVAMPVNKRARVTQVKSVTTLNSRSELERALRGEMPLQLSRGAAAKIALAGWPGLVGDTEQTEKTTRLGARIDHATAELTNLKGLFK